MITEMSYKHILHHRQKVVILHTDKSKCLVVHCIILHASKKVAGSLDLTPDTLMTLNVLRYKHKFLNFRAHIL